MFTSAIVVLALAACVPVPTDDRVKPPDTDTDTDTAPETDAGFVRLPAGSNTSTEVAWTAENVTGSTHAVGGLAPNACGLYDMSGNVFEWTQDWFDDYPTESVTDPLGAESGRARVYRGGDWFSIEEAATVSYRGGTRATYVYGALGFRVARSSF